MLNFGDIFEFESKEYVYLSSSGELIYAALIVDKKFSKILIDRFYNLQKDHRNDNKLKTELYCFVVLKTDEYLDRVAHLKETAHESEYIRPNPTGIKLCYDDLAAMKDEILGNSTVPKGLKTRIKEIDIKKPKLT